MKWGFYFLIIIIIPSCSEKNFPTLTCRVKWREIEISAPYPSEVTRIFVEEGMRVNEGQELLALDKRELEIQIEGLKKGIDAQNHRIRSLEIIKEQLSKNIERAKSLEKVGGVSQINVEEMETRLHSTLEELKSAREMVEAEEKKIEALQLQIEKSSIRAPSEGMISRIFVEKGERALPGFTLLKIEAPPPHAICYVSHSLMSKLRIGGRVVVEGGLHRAEGEISFISSEPEFTPKYYVSDDERDVLHYMVKVKIKGEDFKNGEFVRVKFLSEKND